MRCIRRAARLTVGRTSVPFSRITTGLPWLSLAIIWQSLSTPPWDHSGPQGTPRHRAVSRLSVDRKHDAPFHPFVEFISKFNPRTSDRDCHWSLLFVFRHYRVGNRLATSGRLRILPQLSLAATIRPHCGPERAAPSIIGQSAASSPNAPAYGRVNLTGLRIAPSLAKPTTSSSPLLT
jgi:hypothetical protein